MSYAKRKTVRSTGAQVKYLVEYMEANPHLAMNEFTGPLAARQSNREWDALAATLATYGPRKTVDQWKHTWRDLKKRAKEEASIIEQVQNAAGDDFPITRLSGQAQKILDTIGHKYANENSSGKKPLLRSQPHPVVSPTTTRKTSRSTSRVSTSNSYKASWFIRTQEKTNAILEELSKELKISNDLRTQQLSILQVIADRLESKPVCEVLMA